MYYNIGKSDKRNSEILVEKANKIFHNNKKEKEDDEWWDKDGSKIKNLKK